MQNSRVATFSAQIQIPHPLLELHWPPLLLMKRELVSQSGQMELLGWCEYILYQGHRCGACHNASNAKVRIMKVPYEMPNKVKEKYQSTLLKCECLCPFC